MKKNQILTLISIVLISFFLRFWRLPSYPVSLSIDEVIIGYDSYSILKTGKDQWGQFLPLFFKSIGDYKSPVLFYLMIPAIKFFGLNEFGVRFTVAFFGSLTPLLVFFLVKEIFKDKKIAYFTAFLLAISPWHLQYSRASFEAILGQFFFLFGFLLFWRFLRNEGKKWWLASLFFVLSVYSYHSHRLFVFSFIAVLFFLFKQKILLYRKNAIIAVFLAFFLIIPLTLSLFSGEGQARAKSVFITNDYELAVLRQKKYENENFKNLLILISADKYLNTFSFWSKRFLEYTDLSYLFFNGMKLTPDKYLGSGLMYGWELPFFIIGIFCFFAKRKKDNITSLFFWWIILGIIPASLANNSQHPLRSLILIPIPQIMTTFGLLLFFDYLKNKIKVHDYIKKGIISFLCLITVVYLLFYLDLYYIHYPYHFSHYWMYGLKQIAQYVLKNKDKYQKIIIDSEFGIEGKNITGIPFAYVLFYGKIDPKIIQQARNSDQSIFGFENFEFRSVYWPQDRKLKNSLMVATKWQLPSHDVKKNLIMEEIPLYNKLPMFYLVKSEN